jgi:hypothetical protein
LSSAPKKSQRAGVVKFADNDIVYIVENNRGDIAEKQL